MTIMLRPSLGILKELQYTQMPYREQINKGHE